MRDLDWMVGIGDPRARASVMALPKGRRVTVVASQHVFFGVRLEDGEGADLPEYEDRELESGGSQAARLREWLTRECAEAEISVAEVRSWIRADGDKWGCIGRDRYNRNYVEQALERAPEAETVTVGFFDGYWPGGERMLVLTWEGFRAIVAPGTRKRRTTEPMLALPEKARAS